jgi:hypothetical protein
MGETVTASPDLVLEVRVPPLGSPVVRVVRDGEVLHEAAGPAPLRLSVPDPGVYRVEVDQRLNLFPLAGTRAMPWIFSNPIYVRP